MKIGLPGRIPLPSPDCFRCQTSAPRFSRAKGSPQQLMEQLQGAQLGHGAKVKTAPIKMTFQSVARCLASRAKTRLHRVAFPVVCYIGSIFKFHFLNTSKNAPGCSLPARPIPALPCPALPCLACLATPCRVSVLACPSLPCEFSSPRMPFLGPRRLLERLVVIYGRYHSLVF